MLDQIGQIKVGDPSDFTNFMGAVIDAGAFRTIKAAIDYAKRSKDAGILCGGTCDSRGGYFIEPTVIFAKRPEFRLMREEIFARDRAAILRMTEALTHTAGNFYINDKPTGAVVGQQPFGGGRASGTNDKAGSLLNLIHWVSPRSIKETFLPPTQLAYPFMQRGEWPENSPVLRLAGS